MLSVRNLHAGYNATTVLRGVSLEVGQGEFVGVLGPNGAGKTTLMRAVMGACTVSSGQILIESTNMTERRQHERVGLGIAYVPDGRRVWPSLSTRDNLLMGAWSLRRRASRSETDDLLEQALTTFPALRARLKTRAGLLSGGEQQMLAIGRALMSRPRLLLIDEPSTGLSPVAIDAVVQALRSLHQTYGLSVLLVEQRADVASSLCERGYILNRGEVVRSGPVDAMFEDLSSGYFASAQS